MIDPAPQALPHVASGRAPAGRLVVVGLLVLAALAGVLPVVAFYASWVDLDGYGDMDLTVPLLGLLETGAALAFAWVVLRRRAMLAFYTAWAAVCLMLIASILARPTDGSFWIGTLVAIVCAVAVLIGVGSWVLQVRRRAA